MESSNGFKVPVTLTEDDFFTFQMQFSKRFLVTSYFAILLCFLIFASYVSMNTVLVFTILAIMLVLPLPIYFSLKKEWKKQFYSNKPLQHNIDYEFSEEGLHMVALNGAYFHPWGEIYTIIEQKSGFLIFQSNRICYFIPKDCLLDDWQLKELRRYMRKTPNRKRDLFGQFK